MMATHCFENVGMILYNLTLHSDSLQKISKQIHITIVRILIVTRKENFLNALKKCRKNKMILSRFLKLNLLNLLLNKRIIQGNWRRKLVSFTCCTEHFHMLFYICKDLSYCNDPLSRLFRLMGVI